MNELSQESKLNLNSEDDGDDYGKWRYFKLKDHLEENVCMELGEGRNSESLNHKGYIPGESEVEESGSERAKSTMDDDDCTSPVKKRSSSTGGRKSSTGASRT